MKDFNISRDKIHYLPFGVDTDIFIPLPVDTGNRKNTIEVFSNRGFYPVYDMETLVQGFARAYQKEHRLRLTLKCEGPEEQKIQNLVHTLGIASFVTFKKKTSFSEVPLDYRNADIFLTTSVSDGTPVSISEAMASGIPCIATTVGGIPEWVEDQKTGLLIPPRSPEAVAQAILSLAQNSQFRSELGKNAREKIVKMGEWKTLMLQAEKDYLALIEKYRKEKS